MLPFLYHSKNIVAVKLNTVSNENIPAKVLLQGPSGCGKSYSALLLAFALTGSWEKIAVLETNYMAANHYSDLGPFNTVLLAAPFYAEQFQDAIELCENSGIEAIVIDSLSASWNGPGGVLDRLQLEGASSSHWHESLLTTIKTSPCHILATLQVEEQYVVRTGQRSQDIDKLGLQPVQQADIHYHFHTVLYIDMQHRAKAFKDRSGFFHDHGPVVIDEEIAALFAQWIGAEKQNILTKSMEHRIAACTSTGELLELLLDTYAPNEALRQAFQKRKLELQKEESKRSGLYKGSTSNGVTIPLGGNVRA